MKPGASGRSISWNRWLTALLVSVICIGMGLGLVDMRESFGGLAALDARDWIVVMGFCLIMAALRAARVVMVARAGPALPVVKASLLHGAAMAILPARTGEAVLPLALARYSGIDLMRAVGLLIIVRIGDLMALGGISLMLVAALNVWGHTDGVRLLFTVAGAAAVLAIAVVPEMLRLLCRWAPKRFRSALDRLAAAGAAFRLGSRIGLVASTLAIWLTLALAARVAVDAAGLQIDLAHVWLACAAASLAFALPTNGIASIGPFEAAFVGVLAAAGASAEAALTAAVHLHLCALLAAGLAALVALAFPTPDMETARCH